jgi:hypothetical protein
VVATASGIAGSGRAAGRDSLQAATASQGKSHFIAAKVLAGAPERPLLNIV